MNLMQPNNLTSKYMSENNYKKQMDKSIITEKLRKLKIKVWIRQLISFI